MSIHIGEGNARPQTEALRRVSFLAYAATRNANRRRNCPGRSHPLEVHEAYKLAGQLAKASKFTDASGVIVPGNGEDPTGPCGLCRGHVSGCKLCTGVDQRLQAVHGLQDSCFSERSRFQTLRPNMTSKSGLCGRILNQALVLHQSCPGCCYSEASSPSKLFSDPAPVEYHCG